jgi:predicted nucleotidyltransferase
MTEEVRSTDDVDIVLELWAYKDYAAIEEQLRKRGFENDQESGVICRYKVQGIIVDVMPTGEKVLNFSNRWYPDGYKTAINYTIDEQHIIKIFTAPYFLASKLEAFKSRGKNDGRSSTDFEDIIYVLENRRSVWDDIKNAPKEVKEYLIEEFTLLLKNPFFDEWVDAHAGFGSPPATAFILEQLRALTNKEDEDW